MEFSFDFEMTEEKKAIEELLKQKGIRHYVLETKDKEKFDLVEYKDYKILEKEKQELIDYLKNEIQNWKDKIFENSLTEDNFTLALWRSKLITYEKVLNKIEKSDK